MEKIWLKSYPKGVPAEINLDEFTSLVDVVGKTCERFESENVCTYSWFLVESLGYRKSPIKPRQRFRPVDKPLE